MITRVKVNNIIQNQVPEYIKEEYPLVVEFLRQYYLSLENQGNPYDILQNIDRYVKIDELVGKTKTITLLTDTDYADQTIFVNSTAGFPDKNGLIKINNEIVFYKEKTVNSFINCTRGFSGIESYKSPTDPGELVFSDTETEAHLQGDTVENLFYGLFIEFLRKLKSLVAPGFEDKDLFSDLNQATFIKQSGDFYRSKGTDTSFRILFGALYGKKVEVIKPKDYLIEPSAAQYRITRDFVVEAIEGDPLQLVNRTIYQDNGFLKKSSGTVTNVEKILRGDKTYYVLSLDFEYDRDINVTGTIFGDFDIHPKTIVTNNINPESTVIDVDSTVGFPDSGELIFNLDNDLTFSVFYQSKSLTQFYNCVGIIDTIPIGAEAKLNVFAYGIVDGLQVTFRITGVLSDINVLSPSKYYSKGDLVQISNLGYDKSDVRLDDWFYNFSIEYNVKEIELIDSVAFTYRLTLFDRPQLNLGDSITIISPQQEIPSQILIEQGSIVTFDDRTSFIIGGQGQLDTNLSYRIRKNILKANFKNFPNTSNYNSNVQNTYYDLKDESVYVAAASLPSYNQTQLQTTDGSIFVDTNVNGTLIEVDSHYFYTGDAIAFKSDDENVLATGIYFIKREGNRSFKLSRSKNEIYNEDFVIIVGRLVGKFEFYNFNTTQLETKILDNQKLIRRVLKEPKLSVNPVETKPGIIGILNNGVEILNYKSSDSIFYGAIKNVSVTNPGSGYDIINPPIITILDPNGSGSVVHPSVIGELKEIQILDPGFDYLDIPRVVINGGNGSGAEATANLIKFTHQVQFAASSINTTTNVITTLAEHKFRDQEQVIYSSQGQAAIGGLVDGSTYFVRPISQNQVKLYYTETDTTEIDLTSSSIGNHLFTAIAKKNKIRNITVTNPGSNYKNSKTVISSVGINTANDTITIPNHTFVDKDIISYSTDGTPVGGISTTQNYYVKKLDQNTIKLCGISTTSNADEFYNQNKFIDLTSQGSGKHTFNHQPIVVSVEGITGVSTFSTNNSKAVLQPIFEGNINSVFVEEGGNSYGVSEIINLIKQPQFLINTGSSAQVRPIIANGQIVDIIVLNPGTNYNTPPRLVINGDGYGAVLTPVINLGILEDVIIVSGGSGYSEGNTTIEVQQRGSGAQFEAAIEEWRINLVERYFNSGLITDDDGIIADSLEDRYGLQYTHLYPSRKLREAIFAKRFFDGKTFFKSDLLSDYDNLKYHSPIIGWAYDGNPIYGPYGYRSPQGGDIVLLTSGYELKLKSNRPSTTTYPLGFFVEDYEFTNSGDLDEHNGRFTITPEFPNGVYAYFTPVNSVIETNGVFVGYKKPQFPYVIGNTYKSIPDEFNFLGTSNQDETNLNQKKWLRNTSYYNIFSENSNYQFLSNPNQIKKQTAKIAATKKGGIDFVDIVAKGNNYKITDKIVFENDPTKGRLAKAKITQLSGKQVSSLTSQIKKVSNIEITPLNENTFIGITTEPHYLDNGDQVNLTTNFEYNVASFVGVSTNQLTLTTQVQPTNVTGIVTYFNVFGNLNYPTIKENDLYEVNGEQVKILNIDNLSSRVRVLRNQNLTVGNTTYSSGTTLKEFSNKITVNLGINTNYQYKPNREYYFIPSETLGIGTGIGHTLTFANPGAGLTSLVIPTKTLYFPNHNLNTGDELVYRPNQGSSIGISTDGIANTTLPNGQSVYVAKISNDLIGIALEKVGIGSTGKIQGLTNPNATTLFFTGIGTGVQHSFKTNYDGNIIAETTKTIVTIATSEPSGLKTNDEIELSCISGITTTIKVEYNDYHRKLILNARNFVSGNIEVDTNTINIDNHGLRNNQKVIHTSTAPSGGLIDQGIYYVLKVNNNKFKLSSEPVENFSEVSVVNITSASNGRILPINPPLSVIKNSKLVFDVSDSTLSFVENQINYPAFDLRFYNNSDLTEEFYSTKKSSTFEVNKTGIIGVDSIARVTLDVNEQTPKTLYYNLVPIDKARNELVKIELVVDEEIINHNKIDFKDSLYTGKHKVKNATSQSFTFDLISEPEVASYTTDQANIFYNTNSDTALGGISSISIISRGLSYQTIPTVSVSSTTGNDAILFAGSNDIGEIQRIDLDDIGFDYNSDLTIRPVSSLPKILKIEPLSSFESIGVSSVGKNYTASPKLVVIDSFTNKVVDDVVLDYNIANNSVTILKNSSGFYNSNPIIIPTNNSNGIPIKSINFNIVNKDVIVTLGGSFSDPEIFPFAVGDKVLIENSVVSTSGKGYNSKDYNYALFELTNIDSNIAGIAVTVAYNMGEYLSGNETPGVFDPVRSFARIIPQKDFPIFDVKLRKNDFYEGEEVYSGSSQGIVENWDKVNEYLKISTIDDYEIGSLVVGKTSDSRGIISKIISCDSIYNVEPSSVVVKGWKTETGFLNNTLQRLADNDYYQYFSYSLKSEVDYSNWNESVYNLNHTAGFKRFGDLQINSSTESFSGITTSQDGGVVEVINDFYSVVSPNCFYDFDLASENSFIIEDQLSSNEINFNSKIIQNYIESIGNRVLILDDISVDFNNVPREEKFSIVNIDRLVNYRSRKYFTLVQDKRFTAERQCQLVTILHNGINGFMNQYAGVSSVDDLGGFDFSIFGDETYLLFYPTKNKVNDYFVEYAYYSIEDSIVGVGSTALGECVNLTTQTKTLNVGIGTTVSIVSIASSQIAAKVLIQIAATNDTFYEYNEVSVVKNNSDVAFIDYGQIVTKGSSYSSNGIGTYGVSLNGGQISIDFKPNNALTTSVNINACIVSIADTTFTGIGTIQFDNSQLQSFETSIPSSGSPGVTTIGTYSADTYSGSYCVVVVKDITNDQTQISEVVICNNQDDVFYTEFGYAETSSSLGIITCGLSGTNTELYFTPNSSIETKVVVYQHSIGLLDTQLTDFTLDFDNATIGNGAGSYEGTETAIRKDFNLTFQGKNVFQREFNPVQSIDLTSNTIRIPENFFVTGEEIVYDPGEFGSPIGIATTTIAGIGTTDKLPSTLYIIKNNDLNVKVAASASDALATVPKVLSITSVGVGTQHTFTAKDQNSKVVIALDNIIQAPLVGTAITTTLTTNLPIIDNVVRVADSSEFYGGDLIKINDEVMRVNIVGFGSDNYILVQRPWFGTGISSHSSGNLVTKVSGNYNILNNTISFAEAPYGVIPQEDPLSIDSIDFSGIQTSMTFSGRVFIRSGIPDSVNHTYSTNYIFDDVSNSFTGITSEFTLKENNTNISGISSSNAIILYNQVLQTPVRNSTLVVEGNYEIKESSGISSIVFKGYKPDQSYDVNEGTLPRGGVIISVGSTGGLGYQPLVAAGGTAIISAGQISSIAIGNTGSGYRAKKNFTIETTTLGITTAGFTTIYLSNTNSVYGILSLSDTGSNCKVSIGTYINNATIDTINSDNIIISGAGITNIAIPANTKALVSINEPNVGTINVGVANSSTGISTVTHIGYSQISNGRINAVTITNPGIGYTTTNPPTIVFENPLSYSDLPLKYSSSAGIGSGAKVDVIVGQGSSIINFELTNLGYAYKINEVLTVDTDGLYGIPLDSSIPFSEFQIYVNQIYNDSFAGWIVGDLQVIDPIDNLFDGVRTVFPIAIDGERFTIRAKLGSNIDVKANLLISINDVLQVPGQGYIFDGGSTIRFTEPPKPGDKSTILFYRGTGDVDTVNTDILESVKVGDQLTFSDDDLSLQQQSRTVFEILSTDSVITNTYKDFGISQDPDLLRPVTLCQQVEDLFINGQVVTKDREIYKTDLSKVPQIIKKFDTDSSIIFIDDVRPLFDSESDKNIDTNASFILFDSNVGNESPAFATATVSIAGTISDISITDGGQGYTKTPLVFIESPVGLATTSTAVGIASISSGIVTSITITNPGFGYTTTDIPVVMIEPPINLPLVVNKTTVQGDFGIIVGIGTTSTVDAPIGIDFDFFIPTDSLLRDTSIVGSALTISGIQTGFYFKVENSNVGTGISAYDTKSGDGTIIGIGTNYVDATYEVVGISTQTKNIPGIGVTYIKRVTVSVVDNSSLIGLASTSYYGDFSWGRISDIA